MARDYSTVLKGILSASASALNEAGVPPGRVELTPGVAPAWDDCCSGQLYLRVVEVFPSAGAGAAFPQMDSAQRGVGGRACGFHMVAVHIGLGIIRCASTLDDDGSAPTPAEVTADGDEMLDDMAMLLDVLACEVGSLPGVMAVKVNRWTPQGVEGGCHGGEWGAYIGLDPCLCNGN